MADPTIESKQRLVSDKNVVDLRLIAGQLATLSIELASQTGRSKAVLEAAERAVQASLDLQSALLGMNIKDLEEKISHQHQYILSELQATKLGVYRLEIGAKKMQQVSEQRVRTISHHSIARPLSLKHRWIISALMLVGIACATMVYTPQGDAARRIVLTTVQTLRGILE